MDESLFKKRSLKPLELPKFKEPPPSKQEKVERLYWRYKKKTNPKPVQPNYYQTKKFKKHYAQDIQAQQEIAQQIKQHL